MAAPPPPSPPPYPNAPQAVLLVVGLFLAELLFSALLYDLRRVLGLSDDAIGALAVLLGNGLVFTLAMRLSGQGWRQLFHPSPASPGATAALLVVPVLAVAPACTLVLGQLLDWLVLIAPLSRAEELMFSRYASGSLAMAVSVCVLAPMLEEMLFRGLILSGLLLRYPRRQAILGSALLFGAAHLNLYQFVVGVLLGCLLGWLYERSRSLIPCITLHAAYNTLLLLAEPAAAAPGQPAVAWLDGSEAWALALPAAGAGAWCLWRVLKR